MKSVNYEKFIAPIKAWKCSYTHSVSTEGIKHVDMPIFGSQQHKLAIVAKFYDIGFWIIPPDRKNIKRSLINVTYTKRLLSGLASETTTPRSSEQAFCKQNNLELLHGGKLKYASYALQQWSFNFCCSKKLLEGILAKKVISASSNVEGPHPNDCV